MKQPTPGESPMQEPAPGPLPGEPPAAWARRLIEEGRVRLRERSKRDEAANAVLVVDDQARNAYGDGYLPLTGEIARATASRRAEMCDIKGELFGDLDTSAGALRKWVEWIPAVTAPYLEWEAAGGASATNGSAAGSPPYPEAPKKTEIPEPAPEEPAPEEPANWGTPKEAALRWFDAGWEVFPLPENRKSDPPGGTTGRGGKGWTREQLDTYAWGARDNVAIRMPEGCVGVDIDAYKDVAGGGYAEIIKAATSAARLPGTWRSTGRDPEEGPSGIYLYRWNGGELPGAAKNMEIIQRHHRYAIVAPSRVHDAKAKRDYRLYDHRAGEGGREVFDPPRPGDLPELGGTKARWDSAMKKARRKKAGKKGSPPAGKRPPGSSLSPRKGARRWEPEWRPGEVISQTEEARHDQVVRIVYHGAAFAKDLDDLRGYAEEVAAAVEPVSGDDPDRDWLRESGWETAPDKLLENGSPPFSGWFEGWREADRSHPGWVETTRASGRSAVFRDPDTGKNLAPDDERLPEWIRQINRKVARSAGTYPGPTVIAHTLTRGGSLSWGVAVQVEDRPPAPLNLSVVSVMTSGGGKTSGYAEAARRLGGKISTTEIPASAQGVQECFGVLADEYAKGEKGGRRKTGRKTFVMNDPPSCLLHFAEPAKAAPLQNDVTGRQMAGELNDAWSGAPLGSRRVDGARAVPSLSYGLGVVYSTQSRIDLGGGVLDPDDGSLARQLFFWGWDKGRIEAIDRGRSEDGFGDLPLDYMSFWAEPEHRRTADENGEIEPYILPMTDEAKNILAAVSELQNIYNAREDTGGDHGREREPYLREIAGGGDDSTWWVGTHTSGQLARLAGVLAVIEAAYKRKGEGGTEPLIREEETWAAKMLLDYSSQSEEIYREAREHAVGEGQREDAKAAGIRKSIADQAAGERTSRVVGRAIETLAEEVVAAAEQRRREDGEGDAGGDGYPLGDLWTNGQPRKTWRRLRQEMSSEDIAEEVIAYLASNQGERYKYRPLPEGSGGRGRGTLHVS